MHVLVVPMNPEFLPEAALLLGGVLLGGAALRHFARHERSRSLRIGALGVACIVLAVFMGRNATLHSNGSLKWKRAQEVSAQNK